MQTSAKQKEASQAQSDKKLLSCVHCRQRKVKCSRTYPCTQCVRQQLECRFPSRKKTERKHPRRQDELLDRLARLEAIVGQVSSGAQPGEIDEDEASVKLSSITTGEAVATPVEDAPSPAPVAVHQPLQQQHQRQQQQQQQQGQQQQHHHHQNQTQGPVSVGPSNKFLSGDFWSNLCSEVEGLKQALEQPSESEDDEPVDESSPSSHQTAATPNVSQVMLASPASSFGEPLHHPPEHHVRYLSSVYWANVDPVFKIFHRPTLEPLLNLGPGSSNLAGTSKETEVLFFAIYFAAVVSLPPDVCLQMLGEEWSVLYKQYKLNVELALNRADYLDSSRLEPLQALTIYVACLRTNEQGRSSWALLALAVRLAHALNLHRDGSGSAFPPFEAEMRRRLWWHLVILDVRAVEDRGSEPIIASEAYNVAMMTNIEDKDFGPNSRAPLVKSDSPTELTFCLSSAMASRIFLFIYDPSARFSSLSTAPATAPQTEHDLLRTVQELEALFVDRVDPNNISSVLACATVRIIVLKIWLAVQYPFHMQLTASAFRPRVSREYILRTAIAIMELCETATSNMGGFEARFAWWTATYVQWHPLAVALAELCTQSQGELPDRAWQVVDRVLPQWGEIVADTKRGNLWRPIRKLAKKARAVRLESQLKGLGFGQDVNYGVMKEGEGGMLREPDPIQAAANQRAMQTPSSSASGWGTSQFFDQPIDFSSFAWPDYTDLSNTGGSIENAEPDAMDWSTWNEFMADTRGFDLSLDPG